MRMNLLKKIRELFITEASKGAEAITIKEEMFGGETKTDEQKCKEFWEELKKVLLELEYEEEKSDTGTDAEYLFPKGTGKYLTWLNKPYRSFRIASFWSWFANTNRCIAPENYIQCYNVNFGKIEKRKDKIKGTPPKRGWAVAYTPDGYHYHTIFGKTRSKTTNEWDFIYNDVEKALKYCRDLDKRNRTIKNSKK